MTPKTSFFPRPAPCSASAMCETIRVVLDFDFPAEHPFEVRLQRLAVHANRVGIFQQAGARRDGAGRADAERMRRAPDAGGQFVMQPLDAVQDVGVTLFLLRLHALAEKLLPLGIQNNAFNLRAAEVYADAKHDFKSSAMTAIRSFCYASYEVLGLDAAPFSVEVFGDEPPMTLVR